MSIYKAALITVSDKGSLGERIDTAGPACCEILKSLDFEIAYTDIVPDEIERIQSSVKKACDELNIPLVITCGGTGFSKRDVTPEAITPLFDRQAPGFAEAMRAESLKITPKAVLSRAVSGLRGESIIITLPGSKKSATENLNAVASALRHGVEMVKSTGSNECAKAEGETND